ncbi:MAG: flagellar type III secretion system pore protein FliP [Planctomycetota bacterium]|jgi:flagellar biosynthetic protein FliP|nr:flagellar type III secretion system pore protein FliP [Planctomycetota bacterium]
MMSLLAQAAPALESINPIGVVEDAAKSVPGFEGGLSAALNVILLLTILTIAPAILILCTSFTRMVVVLGLLRQALGTQTLPPSQVVVGLSVLLTAVAMSPTFSRMWDEGLGPYARGEQKNQLVAWEGAKKPLREFMIAQIEATGNVPTVLMILEHRGIDVSSPENLTWEEDVDLLSLIPSFVISELKTAFLIGFRIYLPFLVIDMVISSLLVSMGMMMLPPVLVSLPFKLLLFVLVDGWSLVVSSLLSGVMAPLGGT